MGPTRDLHPQDNSNDKTLSPLEDGLLRVAEEASLSTSTAMPSTSHLKSEIHDQIKLLFNFKNNKAEEWVFNHKREKTSMKHLYISLYVYLLTFLHLYETP